MASSASEAAAIASASSRRMRRSSSAATERISSRWLLPSHASSGSTNSDCPLFEVSCTMPRLRAKPAAGTQATKRSPKRVT